MTRYAQVIRIVFALAVVLVLPALALAADAAPVSAPLLDEIVKAVAALVGLLAAYALKAVAEYAKGKGVELSILEESRREQIAKAAVLAVEERAAAWAKSHEGDVMRSEEKMSAAAEKVLDKIPGIDALEARDLVAAALPRLALGAAEALRAARE
jgi:hypothetical protein